MVITRACALVIIDYQPVQVSSVKSMDQGLLGILFGGERPLAGASTEPAGNGVRTAR